MKRFRRGLVRGPVRRTVGEVIWQLKAYFGLERHQAKTWADRWSGWPRRSRLTPAGRCSMPRSAGSYVILPIS